MPIMIPPPDSFPLRGYKVYSDDLVEIAALVGGEPRYSYWMRGGLESRDTHSLDRLVRSDVGGFVISGAHASFTLHRQSSYLGKKGLATVQTHESGYAPAIIALLQPQRFPLPWSGHRCRLIPRTRADDVQRRRWTIGIVATALSVVVAVIGLLLAL